MTLRRAAGQGPSGAPGEPTEGTVAENEKEEA